MKFGKWTVDMDFDSKGFRNKVLVLEKTFQILYYMF
jgi:hypothetical protein